MATLDKRTDPRVARFIGDTLGGSGKVCRLTRLAVQRHVADLERSQDKAYPYWFDFESAQIAIDFCKLVRHWKGEWVGHVFDPRPDQAFALACLFGWKRRADSRRRYREFLYEVGKKNGKTFMAAVIALMLLVLDGEAGAEIYSTATHRDQAALAWRDAAAIVRSSPALASRIQLPKGRYSYTMFVEATGSKYQALSSEDTGHDGVMPHGIINDELHRQEDRALYDVLKYGSRARRQPMFGHFTTAGDELDTTLYGEIHDYAVEVLEGLVTGPAADEFFALVFTLDEDDDWKDSRVWIKANPGLGINLRMEDLQKDFEEAMAKPAAEAAFKRLRLNTRTSSVSPWIRAEAWDACFDPELVGWDGFDGKQCFGGLDLAANTDLTAFDTLFLHGDLLAVRSLGWCPEEQLASRADRDRAPYIPWRNAGWLVATPGNTTDYRWIEDTLYDWSSRYRYFEIGFDQARSADVAVRMVDAGLPLVAVPQGPVHMTAPIHRLEDLVLGRKIRHDGNPLLKWCIANAQVVDAAGGLKRIRKANYRARIDAAMALLMALSRYMTVIPSSGASMYDDLYDEVEGATSGEHQADSGEAASDRRRPTPSMYDELYEDTP